LGISRASPRLILICHNERLMMKIEDWNFRVSRCTGNISLSAKYDYLDGTVSTPHGIVSCYAQGDKSSYRFSSLSFIYRGIDYRRNFNGKRYSSRGLVTKAKEFANEIIATR
jgi:hypothetical protein